MRQPKILIATSKYDVANYGKVRDYLVQNGYEVVLFEPDSIADGSKKFSVHISPKGKMVMEYDGRPFVPEDFGAAWHRRPNYFGEHRDPLRWLSLKDEYGALMKSMSEFIPDAHWLNAASTMRRLGVKLPQLVKAAEWGFVIPETAVSNSWEQIEKLQGDRLAVKLAEMTVLYPKGGRKVLHTTNYARGALPKQVQPYPGIWQPFLPKKKEWRVTVVGKQVFSAAIYTDQTAKDDWRKHQETPKVVFKAEQLPHELAEKCVTFLHAVNLRYGAFDFVEKPNGEIVFLEVNPNGQFVWLEDKLGLPISKAIGDELIYIAKHQKM